MGAGQSTQPVQPSPAFPASDQGDPPAPTAAGGDGGEAGGCPMKNGDGSYRAMPGFESVIGRRMMGTLGGHPPLDPASAAAAGTSAATESAVPPAPSGATAPGGGCPVQHAGGPSSSSSWSYLRPSSWSVFRRGRDTRAAEGSGGRSESDDDSACPVQRPPQHHGADARPLPLDPANHMPVAAARDALPAPGQAAALPTARVASTIPKEAGGGGGGPVWTYPSPQMFYNALARKGKLDEDTREEDMASVVAIHNAMNEGTWERILQWEEVLCPPTDGDNADNVGPSLTKFMGRPTDLSPKAFFKHYLLGHPLPFDRHDWTVTRTDPADGATRDVRYVIDYFHDDAAAAEEEGSGLPALDAGIGATGRLRSLLVDVRPAADGVGAVWGRLVDMPLARRGCRSMLECLLFKGHGSGPRSAFEPLPLAPDASLKESLGESQEVWADIQRDAATKQGAGAPEAGGDEACASEALEEAPRRAEEVTSAAGRGRGAVGADADAAAEAPTIARAEAARLAASFADVLSQCRAAKAAVQACASDEECHQAFTGMTVCAGQFLCPPQHASLVDSLTRHDGAADEELAEAKISAALDVLGECVATGDARARAAQRQFPEVFAEVLGE